MINLFNAISTRWIAEMAARVLYNTEAVQEAAYPYTTVSVIHNEPDGTFTEEWERYLIQFNLFSKTNTAEEVNLTFAALKAAFDKHDLVITGATTISLMRQAANLIRVEKVWQLNVSYLLEIELD